MPRKKKNPSVEVSLAPAIEPPAPPTNDEDGRKFYARIKRMEENHAQRRGVDEALDDLYRMKRNQPAGAKVETVVSSKPFDAVNLGVDLLTTYAPLWRVPPATAAAEDRQQANLVETWLAAVLYHIERYSNKPIVQALSHHAFRYGRFCLRALLKESSKDEIPFRVQVRDPKYVFPEFDEDNHLYAIAEVFDRPMRDVRRTYPDFVAFNPYKDNALIDDEDMVEWAEYWDAEYFALFAAGKLVESKKHGLGCLPYIFRYGRYVPSDKPEEEAVSLLSGMRFTVPQYDRLLSYKSTAVMQYVNGVLIVKSDRGDEWKLDLSPGAQNFLHADEDVQWLPRQGPMPDLDDLLKVLDEEIKDTSFRSLSGDITTSSGFAFQQASRAERHKINPVKLNLETGLSEMGKLFLKLAAKSKRKIAVMPPMSNTRARNPLFQEPVVMTPEVARQYNEVYAMIPPDFLEDKVQAVSMALQATNGPMPLLDRNTARQDILNIANPEAVEESVLAQKLVEAAIPQFIPALFQRLGMAQQQQAQAQQAQADVQPNAGMPVTTPPQGMGMPPDATAGVPPTSEGNPLEEGVNQLLGQGVQPDEAQARLQGLGTPQAQGFGR